MWYAQLQDCEIKSQFPVINSICKFLLACDELGMCSVCVQFVFSLCSVYQWISLIMHKCRIVMKRKEVVIRQPRACTDGVGRWGTSDSRG